MGVLSAEPVMEAMEENMEAAEAQGLIILDLQPLMEAVADLEPAAAAAEGT